MTDSEPLPSFTISFNGQSCVLSIKNDCILVQSDRKLLLKSLIVNSSFTNLEIPSHYLYQGKCSAQFIFDSPSQALSFLQFYEPIKKILSIKEIIKNNLLSLYKISPSNYIHDCRNLVREAKRSCEHVSDIVKIAKNIVQHTSEFSEAHIDDLSSAVNRNDTIIAIPDVVQDHLDKMIHKESSIKNIGLKIERHIVIAAEASVDKEGKDWCLKKINDIVIEGWLTRSTQLSMLVGEIEEMTSSMKQEVKELEELLIMVKGQETHLIEMLKLIKEDCFNALVEIGFSKVDGLSIKPMLTTATTNFKSFGNRKYLNWSDDRQHKRVDINMPGSHCFTIKNVFTDRECKYFITETEKLGYQSVSSEFDTQYRNNERVMVMSHEIANLMWKRIAPSFQRKDIFRVIPIGFGNEGTWKPVRLNECIKFSKYMSGTYFLPHIDGPWVPNWDEASIFTIVFYLNDNFEGGETQFLQENYIVGSKMEKNVVATVIPEQGSCLVFNHDTLHQAQTVFKGVKYVARTEVIFKKIDGHLQKDPFAFQNDPNYLKMVTIYQASQQKLVDGKPQEFMDLYYNSLKLQLEAMRSSLPPPIELTNTTFCLDIWLLIFSFLTVPDLLNLLPVSRYMYDLVLDGELWKAKYKNLWPHDNFEDFDVHPYLSDWYGRFKISAIMHLSSCSYGVIDVGSHYMKYVGKSATKSGKLQIVTCPSLFPYKTYYSHYRDRDCSIESNLGTGLPIIQLTKDGWKTLNFDIICKATALHNHLCILVSPDKQITFSTSCIIKSVPIAVAALSGYSKNSGVVISLGHSSSWMSIIKDNIEVYSLVTSKVENNNISTVLSYLINNLCDWLSKNTLGVLDFCCIGGNFGENSISIFTNLCTQEKLKFSIISRVDERFTAPIIGALFMNIFGRKRCW